jgi:hypothetical protein
MQAPPASARGTQIVLALLALVGVVALIGVGVVLTRERNREARGPIVQVSDARPAGMHAPTNSRETVSVGVAEGLTDAGTARIAEGTSEATENAETAENAGSAGNAGNAGNAGREAAREPRAARVSRPDGVARAPRPTRPESGSEGS